MPYQLPSYIPKANIASPVIRYEWDDTHPRRAYSRGFEPLMERLSPLTVRAKIAAAIGVYEWIVGRFAPLEADPLPFQYAEAAWCANVSIHYMDYLELDREDWRGPIRGPLWSAIAILNEMLFLHQEDPEPALRTAWLANLAVHVLPAREPFDHWLEFVVERLKQSYTAAPEGPFENLFDEDRGGPLVAREALDPSFDFSTELSEPLIDQYLRQVNYTRNYFLQSPEEMIDDGFEGTPYKLRDNAAK